MIKSYFSSSSLNTNWMPLFPLNTVLFPRGILPLKVFETRYIDMMRESMKNHTPFGVVLIRSGQEVGAPAEPETVGCLAQVIECDMQTLGILLLRIQGTKRFCILETRVVADNQIEARIEMKVEDAMIPITDIHVRCAQALKIVIDDIHAKGAADKGNAFNSPFALPLQFDEAGWVANRWCEILPIPLKARQKLLELDDAQNRLSVVHEYLRQHEIL